MWNPNKHSLRHNLMLLAMFTSGLSVVLVCAGFLLGEMEQLRQKRVRDLQATAAMLAANSDAALGFESSAAASQFWKPLRAQPFVSAAALYRSDGSVLAAYSRDGLKKEFKPPIQPSPGIAWGRNFLRVTQPVLQGGKSIR